AGRRLGPLLDAHVEPDGAVEGGLLLDEQMGQVVGERLQVLARGEVALDLGPAPDSGHHPEDELPRAVLPLRRSELAPEILRGHDVRGRLAPAARNLDAMLLEDRLASLVVDD